MLNILLENIYYTFRTILVFNYVNRRVYYTLQITIKKQLICFLFPFVINFPARVLVDKQSMTNKLAQ